METGRADLHKGRTHEEKGIATESWCMSKVVGEEELAKTQILVWEALGIEKEHSGPPRTCGKEESTPRVQHSVRAVVFWLAASLMAPFQVPALSTPPGGRRLVPREVHSSIRGARESRGLLSSHFRANETSSMLVSRT